MERAQWAKGKPHERKRRARRYTSWPSRLPSYVARVVERKGEVLSTAQLSGPHYAAPRRCITVTGEQIGADDGAGGCADRESRNQGHYVGARWVKKNSAAMTKKTTRSQSAHLEGHFCERDGAASCIARSAWRARIELGKTQRSRLRRAYYISSPRIGRGHLSGISAAAATPVKHETSPRERKATKGPHVAGIPRVRK